MADQRDLTFVEENDPLVQVDLRRELEDGSTEPVDLDGLVVEVIVKRNAKQPNDEAVRIATDDPDPRVTLVEGVTGRVEIQFRRTDFEGARRRNYHISVIDGAGHRVTYIYGQINFIDV